MGLFSGIKSIQRGTIALTGAASNTATLSPAVDTTKTELRFLGFTTNVAGALNESMCKVVLTNSTTVTATKDSASNNASVSWEITEYY